MSLSIRGFLGVLRFVYILQPVGLPKLKTRPKCQANDDFQGEVGEVSAIPQKPRLEKADFTAGVGTWNEIQAGTQDDGKMAAIGELPEGLD